MTTLSLTGVVVATVLPFDAGQEIDWASYARVVRYCVMADGISAVLVNGHAGEGGALTPDERDAVIRATRKTMHDGGQQAKPLIAGIIAQSTREAVLEARLAKAAGADALTIFPPASFGGARTEMVVSYVRAIIAAADLPVAIFQYPLASAYGYSTQTLIELAKLPRVIAIKEGSDTMRAYEENRAAIKAERTDLSVLASNFDWFLAQLAVGADGILSGLAALVPDDLVALWRAGAANDLPAMRAASNKMLPLVRAIYALPRNEMYARIKVALAMMHVIASPMAREPFVPVPDVVCARIRAALIQMGLLDAEGRPVVSLITSLDDGATLPAE
ncbi:dihydrodipicolinate synthase family protein [Robbsia andropogonis]|uniref:dihydrodipicolinate synthase family protein n=1 Tax=Robbsia andropogonis TaxID=28092 RepID=UPI0020A0D8D8|nr:dihydrodipicolinate synthase family protein [Robbsia andropogonis]MCP1117269.1 dihydrodipicolinate synthase family protein [Robbsia andropogonis]MCP1129337.1 dihydrodipicolinate synthase family protein [Robbsia andropogonis]